MCVNARADRRLNCVDGRESDYELELEFLQSATYGHTGEALTSTNDVWHEEQSAGLLEQFRCKAGP